MIKYLGILLALTFCSSNINLDDAILGKWLMYKVIQDGNDVTAEHNPHDERFFVLKADGSFASGGRPYGDNTGKFSWDNETSKLYLDSDVGEEDDSQWKVQIEGDTMRWTGFGTEWAERFQIIHLRSDQE